MKKYFHEQGSTLIVVLILLVVISVIGLYAIRHSLTSLKLATNAQVQTLLMQTSDVALAKLERNFNNNEASNLAGTPVGQVLLDGNQGKELQFCFKPTEVSSDKTIKNNLFFDLRDFRIIERKSATDKEAKSTAESGDINAVCNPETMFSISRKALVTQVAVVSPDDPAVEMGRFDLTAQGTDLKDAGNIETKRVRVTVTSFAPALAPSVSISDMNTCLKERMMDDSLLKNRANGSTQVKVQTLHECLNLLGMPLNTQTAEYVVNLSEVRSGS
ncbi:hypothetical protein CDG60_16490 [Acinetobacter chinensis]|uniref:Type 4 fimbrial biogenesis protein PilX N-terminal domain-containing protein n=1 Tax=Acinetobacter chinensis TaxID=2004650 RepID=A0A3B7M1H6_9GAMM|nr:PilX N-terminal domain-containing pilus assembly protein [Acinetobacter chinensis]AXY58014.1 hypothetical protein CDG60_16490 [Acinetobacter chinensis]